MLALAAARLGQLRSLQLDAGEFEETGAGNNGAKGQSVKEIKKLTSCFLNIP